MDGAIRWLLEGDPWVEYRTRVDLLGQAEGDPEVAKARLGMVRDGKMSLLLEDLRGWPGAVLSSHKSAGQLYHKMAFVADVGFRRGDPRIEEISGKVFSHASDEGPFQLPINIPEHFGGSGRDAWGWALCDAPTVIYALAKFGYGNDDRVRKAAKFLAGLARDNGWPCAVSKELGKFRGPGRKEDPCPYATLIMMKMMLQFEEWKGSEAVHAGAEAMLGLWERSREAHPYMFYMGTDFRKLKAPFIWYDIMHVLDALSQCSWLGGDPRLLEMARIVKGKADGEGKFTPESEWKAWKGWDFGQKKEPSRWLTLLALRILRRIG
ncbi:MAG: hypothetical protein NO516_03835 [Candidatus Methanomethylicia archaeon]|nr:hypothetical protein [Candidatus Methanomethylicia archaeon]